MMYYVYALVDPATDLPFYIGKGKGRRYNHHLRWASVTNVNYRKRDKIEAIRATGSEPVVRILAEGMGNDEAYDFEDILIKQYGRIGIEPDGILTNLAIGRRRPPVTKEVARKISETKKAKGVKFTPEHREKLRAAKLGRKLSTEHKQKIADSNKGKICSDDTKAKISKANRNKPRHEWTAESRAKVASTLRSRGIPPHDWSEESRNKISLSQKGKPSRNPWTKESREKLSRARKGKRLSEATKQKISETKRAKANANNS